MEYRFSGNSGLQLPLISLGLWHNFGSEDPFDIARAMLLHAWDNGVTHFDIANNYGPAPGTAEETFGRVLREDLAAHRDAMIISSKAGYWGWDGPYGNGPSRIADGAVVPRALRHLVLPGHQRPIGSGGFR